MTLFTEPIFETYQILFLIFFSVIDDKVLLKAEIINFDIYAYCIQNFSSVINNVAVIENVFFASFLCIIVDGTQSGIPIGKLK